MNRLFIYLLAIILPSFPVVAQFKVPTKKTPAAPANSGRNPSGYASPVYRQPPMASRPAVRQLPATQNLLLATDSACVVTMTGTKVYSFTLGANEKKKVTILPSEYLVEAKSTSPAMPVLHWSKSERVGDELKIVTIDFQRLIPRPTSGRPDTLARPAPKPPRYKEPILNELSNNMILIDGGTFEMGDPFVADKEDNQPVHTVKLSTFYMSCYEVTVKEFRHFLNETGHKTDAELTDGGLIKTANAGWEKRKGLSWNTDATGKIHTEESMNDPVLFVSWRDAKAFCQWLSNKTNRLFDLPTEAQWEYAARGGNRSAGHTYGGSGKPDEVAWFGPTSGRREHPVGQKKANELGLFDLSGNVWEWCADWYDKKYYAHSAPENPPGSTKGKDRVIRGGSWASDLKEIRLINRSFANPTEAFHSVGFRVVSATP